MDLKKIYSLLYRDFTPKTKADQDSRPVYTAVNHLRGRIYATEGYKLAKVERPYPLELEGMGLSKDGNKVEGNKIRYESVIPRRHSSDTDFTAQVDAIRRAVDNVYKVTSRPKGVKGKFPAMLDLGLTDQNAFKRTFRADWLRSAFQLFKLLDEEFTIRVSSFVILFESVESSSLVLMISAPVGQDEHPVFTIEEALNYVSETKQKANWYE